MHVHSLQHVPTWLGNGVDPVDTLHPTAQHVTVALKQPCGIHPCGLHPTHPLDLYLKPTVGVSQRCCEAALSQACSPQCGLAQVHQC